jgi:DNA-3-methyladenine glycosylase II
MTKPVGRTVDSKARYEIDVTKPYRLDLTVSVLRRLSTNTVDVITPEGEYVRVFDGFRKSVLVRVAQTQPAELTVTIEGCDGSDECAQVLAAVRRIFGVEQKLSRFYSAARSIPWLCRWPFACAV